MSIESVSPSEEVKIAIQESLAEEAPLSHEEIVERTNCDDAQVQRALNELWRDGTIFLTVDRRFDFADDQE